MLRRIEPVTGILTLLCIGWTLVCRAQELSYAEAGALTERLMWEGEYHRVLTAAFLHHMEFWLHIGANALGLFFIGSIVARECGRAAYLWILFLSVCGGWAAGMLWYDDYNVPQMGISGGILGLIGALIAVEWAHAKSLGGFFRARNTWVLIATVVIGAVLTWYMNKYTAESMNVEASQPGHAGGLVVGLLVGLAWFGRRGPRPVLGVIVGLLVGIGPVAYAAFPIYDADFILARGRRAYNTGDEEAAAAYYEQARRIDPGHPLAGARLALLKKDPSYLDGLREPERDEPRVELLRAYLELARERLVDKPDEAAALVARAARFPFGVAILWHRFGLVAQQAQRPALALEAFEQAIQWNPSTSGAWDSAANTLPAFHLLLSQAHQAPDPTPHFGLCRRAITAATQAAHGLEQDLPEAGRTVLESRIFETGKSAAFLIRKFPADHPQAHELDRAIAKLFFLLANNTTVAAKEPEYLLIRAAWLARAAGDEPGEEVQAAFRGAWHAAVEYGNQRVQVDVEQWFKGRGLPPPKRELAEDDDDG